MTPGKQSVTSHYLRYSTSSFLAIIAGFISFPVLTRLLDNTQYGILGYYDTWVLMGVAVGKLGAQHAILRFYPHSPDPRKRLSFSTNLFYLPLAISFVIWLLVGSGLAAFDLASGLRQSPVFWMAIAAAPMAVFSSLTETVLRITENSKLVMLTRVAGRWIELILMLGAVILLQHSAVAAYGGKLAAALLVVGFYVRWARRNLHFSRSSIELPALREGLIYGLPLVANEIIAVSMISVDRLMIKGMLGDFAAVGVYSIGASLAMQVNVFTSLTVFEAFTPMANRLFVTEGAEAVRELKRKILRPMTYASVGVAMLLGFFGTDVIIALSGAGKAGSGPVFSMIGIVYSLQPVLLVSGYGLLLEKRSTKVLALMAGTLLINGGFNLLLIPQYGIMGAVYATVISSAALAVAHCIWVPRAMLELPSIKTWLTAGGAATCCALPVWLGVLDALAPGWSRLFLGATPMAVAYGLAVVGLDGGLRTLIWAKVSTWRRGAGA